MQIGFMSKQTKVKIHAVAYTKKLLLPDITQSTDRKLRSSVVGDGQYNSYDKVKLNFIECIKKKGSLVERTLQILSISMSFLFIQFILVQMAKRDA